VSVKKSLVIIDTVVDCDVERKKTVSMVLDRRHILGKRILHDYISNLLGKESDGNIPSRILDVVYHVQEPMIRSIGVERSKKSKQCSHDRRGPAPSIFKNLPDKVTFTKSVNCQYTM
jgi:hypothetical protein